MAHDPSPKDTSAEKRAELEKPSADWSYAEWEAYRLRGENEELRAQLAEMTSPRQAQWHALRWAGIIGLAGVELALAIATTGTLSIILWAIFAAHILGLAAYGITMDNYRSSLSKRTAIS